ncbi:signal transduction histidine kinase [Bradyrhizobium sp. S3.9.2]|uniref:tetratricopeptide repeat protein n=1 Tax=unclassified Bradyrhizobium TaxID=2631580 RepID=UPI0033961B68
MQLIENLRNRIAQPLGRLNIAARFAVVILACVVIGGLIFWLCNELVYYYVARTYAEELADAYDLNTGAARAVLWASFAAVVVLAGYLFSFSKQKRRIGYAGLLALILGHSLLLARIDANFRKNGVAEKCYVMTRTSIKTLNRAGIDPETGRECRPLTPQIVEKIGEYKRGHRPTQIASGDPSFFDPTTGEPVVWYSKNDRGQIQLFDLMGFHPQTGDELLPVTRDAVEAWKQQNAKVVRRAPVLVPDPEKFGFFDPTTGAAKVWYWRNEAGQYEFYDGPGFHPRSGDPITIITRDVISDWRQQQEVIAARKKAEQEQREKEARERAEREAQQTREAAERDRLSREAAAGELRQRQQSGDECDRLAANPTDARKTGAGVSFDALKLQADQAYDACTKAVAVFSTELRYQYQLGRAAQFKDKKQAFDIFFRLVQASYPAAFDNLGGMYLWDRKDATTAITLFKRGSALGDADSMVSLVDLIDKGQVPTPNPEQTKLALLQRAAELGHAGAQRGYQLELQKLNQEHINQVNQQQMMQLFGAFVQGIARR